MSNIFMTLVFLMYYLIMVKLLESGSNNQSQLNNYILVFVIALIEWSKSVATLKIKD